VFTRDPTGPHPHSKLVHILTLSFFKIRLVFSHLHLRLPIGLFHSGV
jgi:hypothetical protein